MKHIFSNIREYKLMYLSSIIGYNSYIIGFDIGLQNVFINKIDNDQKIYNFLETNTFIYSSILSEYGGLSQLKFNLNDIHYFTKLNEIVFDNINNLYYYLDSDTNEVIVDFIPPHYYYEMPKEYESKIRDKYDEKVLNIVLKKIVNDDFKW